MGGYGAVLLQDQRQETDNSWLRRSTQLAHYFSLLCFLLVIVVLLQTLCLVQITLVTRSQSTLQETKLRDTTRRLEELNQSYQLLFSQYPALNQYCPVSNTTGERTCGPCPEGWTPQGHKCFLFSSDRADWISSQYRCMALGGAVATVRTEEEQVLGSVSRMRQTEKLCGRLTPRGGYRRSWVTYRCSNLLRSICERRQATLQ